MLMVEVLTHTLGFRPGAPRGVCFLCSFLSVFRLLRPTPWTLIPSDVARDGRGLCPGPALRALALLPVPIASCARPSALPCTPSGARDRGPPELDCNHVAAARVEGTAVSGVRRRTIAGQVPDRGRLGLRRPPPPLRRLLGDLRHRALSAASRRPPPRSLRRLLGSLRHRARFLKETYRSREHPIRKRRRVARRVHGHPTTRVPLAERVLHPGKLRRRRSLPRDSGDDFGAGLPAALVVHLCTLGVHAASIIRGDRRGFN